MLNYNYSASKTITTMLHKGPIAMVHRFSAATVFSKGRLHGPLLLTLNSVLGEFKHSYCQGWAQLQWFITIT